MAHTTKYTAPNRANAAGAPIPVVTESAGGMDTPMSPRVQALRKLVASGQYQVSPRHLAHRMMRAAGIKPI